MRCQTPRIRLDTCLCRMLMRQPAPSCPRFTCSHDTVTLARSSLAPQAAATRAVKYGDELSFLDDASPEKRAAAEEHM